MKLFSNKNLSALGKLLAVGVVAGGCLNLAIAGGNISVSMSRAQGVPPAPAAAATALMQDLLAGKIPPAPLLPEQDNVPQGVAAASQNQAAGGALAPAPKASDKKSSKKAPAQGGKEGKKATATLAQPANVRQLPEKYLVVKKEHDAGDLASRLTAARTALAQDRHGAALELFNDLYAQYPKDGRVLIGRAVAMQKLGKNAEALSAYEEALNSDPRNLEALTNMLGILNTQDQGSAVERLLQLQEVYPFNADITAQLGMVYGAAGEYENALKYLDMADALKPGNVEILYNRAVAYDRMGKTRQAADLYHQIVLLASDGSLDRNFPLEAIIKRLAVIR